MIMTAKELAEKLLKHPDYEVRVGVEQRLFGDTVIGYDTLREDMVRIEDNGVVFLGEY
jgi:hypothetical protein